MIIYRTNERKLPGRQNYSWNEYRLEDDRVVRYKCYRKKNFDGHESEWVRGDRADISWEIGDPNMPDWLKKYLP